MAAQPDADNVRGGVEEVFAEGDEGFVAQFLDERVDRHGVDQFVVVDHLPTCEGDDFRVRADGFDDAVGTELGLFFGESFCYCDPDTACTPVGWETEGGVGSPVSGGLLQDNILCDGLEIWGCDTLTEPLALHLVFFSPSVAVRFLKNPPLWLVPPRL